MNRLSSLICADPAFLCVHRGSVVKLRRLSSLRRQIAVNVSSSMGLGRGVVDSRVHVAQAAEPAVSQVANLRGAPRWHPGGPRRLAVGDTADMAVCATSRAGFTAAPRELVRGVLTLPAPRRGFVFGRFENDGARWTYSRRRP